MPTYGRTFTLSTPKNTVNSPASGGGKAGEYSKEAGFLAYYEVLLIEKNNHYYYYYKLYRYINKLLTPLCLQVNTKEI
jgi:chitinase